MPNTLRVGWMGLASGVLVLAHTLAVGQAAPEGAAPAAAPASAAPATPSTAASPAPLDPFATGKAASGETKAAL